MMVVLLFLMSLAQASQTPTCAPCNPCKPTCTVAGNFRVDGTGNLAQISGCNFMVAKQGTNTVPPFSYLVTFTTQFANPVGVIVSGSINTSPLAAVTSITATGFTVSFVGANEFINFIAAPIAL